MRSNGEGGGGAKEKRKNPNRTHLLKAETELMSPSYPIPEKGRENPCKSRMAGRETDNSGSSDGTG